MGDRMDIDPDQIGSAGRGIRSSAERLRSEWATFQQELASYGEPWGNDDLGSLIGMLYQGVHELAADCYQDNASAIDADAERMNTMATNYRETERRTTDQVSEFNRVRDVLG